MFSTDKNIETIVQLIDALKHQGTIRLELLKLDATAKIVKLLTTIIAIAVLLVLLTAALLFLSLAASFFIGSLIDSIILGFLCVALFYILLFIIILSKRKSWIERPLVKIFASILLEKV